MENRLKGDRQHKGTEVNVKQICVQKRKMQKREEKLFSPKNEKKKKNAGWRG